MRTFIGLGIWLTIKEVTLHTWQNRRNKVEIRLLLISRSDGSRRRETGCAGFALVRFFYLGLFFAAGMR